MITDQSQAVIVIVKDCKLVTESNVEGPGRPSPKPNDAFLFISDYPFFIIFQSLRENFPTFHKKCIFHPRKFLMTFLYPLIFAKTLHIPPISGNLLFPPLLF